MIYDFNEIDDEDLSLPSFEEDLLMADTIMSSNLSEPIFLWIS